MAAGAGKRPVLPAGPLVDLHCHVLAGVDDGPGDLRDSVAMARQAERDGIEAVCATPHIRADHDVRIAELPHRVAELNARLTDRGVRTRILGGGEVAAPVVAHLSDRELRAVTLGGGGRWVLLEPYAGPLDRRTGDAVDLLAQRGFGVVLAHPERHFGAELAARLRDLAARGVLVQATAATLLDPGAGPVMLDLAHQGLIHVLGSDSHSSRAGRPVALRAGLRALATVEPTASHLRWIAETAPHAIVGGEPVAAPF